MPFRVLMRLSTTQKIGAGFVAATLILVVGALSYRNHRRALDGAAWVAHTHEVIGRLDAVLADLIDVETGMRGYVITGNARFLEPYRTGVAREPVHMAELRRLTADNPRQQARLDSLQPVIARRIAAAAGVVEARRSEGLESAVRAVSEARGKQLMDDVRARIAVLQDEEHELLGRRMAERAASERRAAVVTLAGSFLAFALVTLMIVIIQRDVALQLATSRERDVLLEREQAAREQLAAIQRVTDVALGVLALDDVLTELMRRLREVLAVDTACVLLVMRDGEHLELCKCVGTTEEIADRVRVPIGRGVEGRIAAARAPISVDDVHAADVFDPVVRETFASLLGAPLVVRARDVAGGAVGVAVGKGGVSNHRSSKATLPAAADEASDGERVIGVVHVATLEPREFTKREEELLLLVAERAAAAIERARLHQAERRSEERFRLLVEGVNDYAIIMLDPVGQVVSWNVGAQRLTGYAAEEIIGEPFVRFYRPEDVGRGVPSHELETARADASFRGEGWRIRRDGSQFWAEVLITAIRDEDDGHLLGFAEVTRDLTERKRAEEALVAVKEAAEAASAAKSRFLATMSHEIRAPIDAVLGSVELLEKGLDGPVTDVQRDQLSRVRASGEHLLRLVSDLLDLAKAEVNQLEVERVRAEASEAATAALTLVHPQAAARGLVVGNRCIGDRDPIYLADPRRVEQVLANLVINAVKFTPSGGRIDIECGETRSPGDAAKLQLDPAGFGTHWCYIRVSDTSPGIAPELRDSVFDPFIQGDSGANPYTREHGGTGLGLAISRRLARLMGGDLTIDTEREQGAAFTLWLPTPADEDGPDPHGALFDAASAKPQRIAGLGVAGLAIAARAPDIVSIHVARLRGELDVPNIAMLGTVQLEDHLGTLLAEFARALTLMGNDAADASRLVQDGTEIQRVIAERHGTQRAGLGWTANHHARELAILREDIEAFVRPELAAHPELDSNALVEVIGRLVANAARVGERARRAAVGS